MWVYTNSPTWELIGNNTRIDSYGFTLIHIRGNSIGTDQTRPDQTHFKSFNRQADRGFATSRLCSDEDGISTNRII
jgi:hypothetical protein